MFTWIARKLASTLAEYLVGGLIVVLLAGGGYYTVKYAWYSWFERPELEKQRDEAIKKWIDEKQRAEDLDKKVTFQKNQLAWRQKVQKESGDVDKAVKSGDIDFFRRNADRLHDYKNPTAPTPTTGSGRKRFKPPTQAGEIH